jgi:cobalt-zinc-cadmium efflux system protein
MGHEDGVDARARERRVAAHVVVDDECFLDGHLPRLLDQLQRCLAGHFDLEHSTFQFEPVKHAAHEHTAHA